MFVRDYWENKPYIMRELRTIVSGHSLAVDYQRKVVKRTLGGDMVGHGGQTFTICGDFGLVCGVYVVPDTALSWAKKAMSEVVERISLQEWRCSSPCTWQGEHSSVHLERHGLECCSLVAGRVFCQVGCYASDVAYWEGNECRAPPP